MLQSYEKVNDLKDFSKQKVKKSSFFLKIKSFFYF